MPFELNLRQEVEFGYMEVGGREERAPREGKLPDAMGSESGCKTILTFKSLSPQLKQ